MTVVFLILLLIGMSSAVVARRAFGRDAEGLPSSVCLGFIGTVLGAWSARALRLPSLLAVHIGNDPLEIVWAIIGAATVLSFLALLRRKNRRFHDAHG